jgi:hypothetical protein
MSFIHEACARLSVSNFQEILGLARSPLAVRGFGLVKNDAAGALLQRLIAARRRR